MSFDHDPAPSPRIHDLPETERPREKMKRLGPGALSPAELLSIFLGTGTVGLNAVEVGQALFSRYRSFTALGRLGWRDLMEQRAVGEVKALHLAAAFELGRRLASETWDATPLDKPDAVAALLGPSLTLEPTEVLKVVLLTVRCTLIGIEEISRGTLTETSAHPREILLPVIRRRAWGFILTHNHPGGDPSPSSADRALTSRLRDAASLLHLNFLDHIIIGVPTSTTPGYFSFREHGMM